MMMMMMILVIIRVKMKVRDGLSLECGWCELQPLLREATKGMCQSRNCH